MKYEVRIVLLLLLTFQKQRDWFLKGTKVKGDYPLKNKDAALLQRTSKI